MQNIPHHICGCIDAIRADLVDDAVADELLAGERIVDGRIGTEVATQFGRRGDSALKRDPVSTRKSLVIEEEKRTVLNNRSANCCAELILDELRSRYSARIVEEVVGVEDRIPKEFVKGAMKRIGARLRRE